MPHTLPRDAGRLGILIFGTPASTPTIAAALALLLTWSGVAGAMPAAAPGAPNRMNNRSDTVFAAGGGGAAQEKNSRTPAQRKIDSQLLYAIYRQRGEAEAKGVPTGELGVRFDAGGRAVVDIRARTTKKVLAKIKSVGGEVISCIERYNDIRAHVPLAKLETLATLKDVFAIMPAAEATTHDDQR